MNNSRRTLLMTACVGVLSGLLYVEAESNAKITDPPDTNTSCDRIRKNTNLSMTVRGNVISMTLFNRDQVPLWVPQDETPSFEFSTEGKDATIPYGYFERIREYDRYSIPPMHKVEPKQSFNWTNQDPFSIAHAAGPGFHVQLIVRVALQAFPESENREQAEQEMPVYLAQSCVLETSTIVKNIVQVGAGHLPPKGQAKAKATIVEFGDFQCPFCGRFFTDIEPKIIQDYVNAGKARFYFRHFAFLGNESVWAAEASECANEQNKFWAYHDYLYTHQGPENSGAFAKDKLEGFAAQLGLNGKKFNRCLESDKYSRRVLSDIAGARKAGVTAVPATFINGPNGAVIYGATMPYPDFQKALEAALK